MPSVHQAISQPLRFFFNPSLVIRTHTLLMSHMGHSELLTEIRDHGRQCRIFYQAETRMISSLRQAVQIIEGLSRRGP